MREQARREGRAKLYDGRWRDRDPKDAPPGVEPVIRLKAPTEGETIIEDQVQGRVVWQNKDLDDLVLLRSDKTPTYMLAVVVDDHDMGVTHVIRGDDHLTNGARQKQIYQALGWPVPVMAHVPLLNGPDGAKLSKRHGALGIDAYWAMGYLPAAMRNYLVRLGWSHGDQEIFSTEEMIAVFDLPQIGRSPARFDFAKLENLNGHYMRETGDAELLAEIERVLPHIAGGADLAAKMTPELRQKLLAAMPFRRAGRARQSREPGAAARSGSAVGRCLIFDRCRLGGRAGEPCGAAAKGLPRRHARNNGLGRFSTQTFAALRSCQPGPSSF